MEDKQILLQQQVRHNAEDLQTFLRDLNNWEEQIKKKDAELSARGRGDSQTKTTLPPVRGTKKGESKQAKQQKNKDTQKKTLAVNESKTTPKQQKIKAYDYRSWDKFDVDKALDDIDKDQPPVKEDKQQSLEEEEDVPGTDGTSEEEEEEDQGDALFRRIQEANYKKEKGNECFKMGNYDQAIEHYTSAIMADPNNAILPANRAMAFLKKQQLAAAEVDCDTALILDPTYIKAYHRRGTARLGLGKLQEARQDFMKVLEVESDNKQALQELARLERLEKEKKMLDEKRKGKDKGELKAEGDSSQNELGTINISKPLDKPAHLRSKKPMIRIPVVDIENDEDFDTAPIEMSSQKFQPKVEPIISETSYQFSNTEPESPAPKPVNRSGKLTPTRTAPPPPIATSSVKTPVVSPVEPTSVPPAPQTYYQFNADFRKLKSFPVKLYEYIKQIPYENYPRLFQLSLESEGFTALLNTYKDYFISNGDDVYTALMHLSQVKRFNTLTMFMSAADTSALQILFDHIRTTDRSSEDVDKLKKLFGL